MLRLSTKSHCDSDIKQKGKHSRNCVSYIVFTFQNAAIPFMQVGALDRDDRNTPHADLRFRLLDQMPRIPASHMFNIDATSGEVSLTEDGNEHRA